MIIQISSGQGPAECELAVSKLFEALKKEYPDIYRSSVFPRIADNRRIYIDTVFNRK